MFVEIIVQGPKKALLQGSIVLLIIRLIKENVKSLLSENTGPRALIFGSQHHLVDLYQVCSNNAPRVKNGLPRSSHVLHRLM